MAGISKIDIVNKIAAIRQELVEQYSVNRIGLFGSYARGEEGQESDVDIVVELNKPTFDHYFDLKFRLEDVLQHPVDLVIAESLKPLIKDHIERDTIYV